MAEVPTLVHLCLSTIADGLFGDNWAEYLAAFWILADSETPVVGDFLRRATPLILLKLQEDHPDDYDSGHAHDFDEDSRKRRKLPPEAIFGPFSAQWEALYKLRWPCLCQHKQGMGWLDKQDAPRYNSAGNWQRMYWEAHLQDCVDAVAETALLPSYDGSVGEIKIPDVILKHIGWKGDPNYLKFSYHCHKFGLHARQLRLPNALCVAEICDLLRSSELHTLELQWIKSSNHVEGLCKLLNQNRGTLKSIKLIHCKLSSSFINAICDSLRIEGLQVHGVEHFLVKRSSFQQTDSSPVPIGLISFLTSARGLQSVTFCDDQLGRSFARVIFTTLLDASASTTVLDLSENDISGFLSQFRWRYSSCSIANGKSLQSLRVLNLRSCTLTSDDAECLKQVFAHLPNMQNLDLSDNMIGPGIRIIIAYFREISNRELPFSDLKLENCELNCNEVIELLQVLSTMKDPLNFLSLKGNMLGSNIGVPLVKFLYTGICAIDVEDIGLGYLGFHQAVEEFTQDSKVTYINISDNQGGIEVANFMSRLISHANNIVAIDARYNSMPMESLSVIFSGLKASKVKLEHLDLSGNSFCDQLAADGASILNEFQITGQFNLLLSSAAPLALHDDDP